MINVQNFEIMLNKNNKNTMNKFAKLSINNVLILKIKKYWMYIL